MITPGTAFLTRLFQVPCKGSVHSVFSRSANILMTLPGGERMLTVCLGSMPPVPDSVILGPGALALFEVGLPAALRRGCLQVGHALFPIHKDFTWTGYLRPANPRPGYEKLVNLMQGIPTGFDTLPLKKRGEALNALTCADAPLFLGLGPGLTPSYDDALIGVMAVYRAARLPLPFHLSGLDSTTAVSARYLTLAREGYFSGPVLDMIKALSGAGDLDSAVKVLSRVGATSGADTLTGMAAGLKNILEPA